MSQIIKNKASGPIPPVIATSYVSDDGTAVPALNILNVLGGPGIETYVDPNLSNNLYISLKDSCTDTATTIGAVSTDIVCLDLGTTPGTFMVTTQVSAYTTAGGTLGAGYFITAAVRTTGLAGTVIGTPDKLVFEEGALSAGNATLGVSGNNLIITVTGTSGYTINWTELTSAVFTS